MTLIGLWIIIGAILFAGSDTPKLFKSKIIGIIAHGPIVWVAILMGLAMGQIKMSNLKRRRES